MSLEMWTLLPEISGRLDLRPNVLKFPNVFKISGCLDVRLNIQDVRLNVLGHVDVS